MHYSIFTKLSLPLFVVQLDLGGPNLDLCLVVVTTNGRSTHDHSLQ